MIYTTLNEIDRIAKLSPAFEKAAQFLLASPETLDNGRYEIDGENVYALIQEYEGKGKDAARLESHQRYIDIQYCISGDEAIGCSYTPDCTLDAAGWNTEKDIAFYNERPEYWLPVAPGTLAILYPEDAHAPMAGKGTVRKVVVKIKV